MFTCLDRCSLHALCYPPYACALYAMFVCLNPGYVCHAMYYCSPFVTFVSLSCVLAYWFRLDLDLMVFVIVHVPWPISKGFGSPLFACLCLFAFLLVCLSRLFACFLVSLLAMYFMLSCFMPLSYAFCIFFLPLLVCWFLIFALACIHMQWERKEIGHDLPSTSKKGKDASM